MRHDNDNERGAPPIGGDLADFLAAARLIVMTAVAWIAAFQVTLEVLTWLRGG